MPSNPRASKYLIGPEEDGVEAQCVVCSHDRFWFRRTMLNTAGMSFLGLEWANKEAANLVCNRCSHMMWFHDGSVLTPLDD